MSVYIEPKEKWEKSKELNGITESLVVAKVENGYIIVKRSYGNAKSPVEGGEGEYKDESKTYISETNPLESEDVKSGVKSLLSEF